MLGNVGLASGSALLGFFTGILPGAGATPASFMAYGFAQKISRHPERFGKGAIAGVVAPEAANNAAGTGAILPMLVLGIPGSPTAAILMAGVFMWGFIPGPRLFTEQPEFVWSFIASLYAANVAAVVICLTATPLLAMMLRTPYAILAPLIVVMSLIGAYAIQNAFLDVWLAVIFGIIGFILRRMDYPLAPLVVALVLGFSTEEALRQSLIMSDGSMLIFFQRPISTPIMIVAILLFLLPVFKIGGQAAAAPALVDDDSAPGLHMEPACCLEKRIGGWFARKALAVQIQTIHARVEERFDTRCFEDGPAVLARRDDCRPHFLVPQRAHQREGTLIHLDAMARQMRLRLRDRKGPEVKDRGRQDRVGTTLGDGRGHVRRARHRLRRHPSGLRLPVRERLSRRGLRGVPHQVHRPGAERHPPAR